MSQVELRTPTGSSDLPAALSGMTSAQPTPGGRHRPRHRHEAGASAGPTCSSICRQCRELAAVRRDDGVLRVGAMATFSQLQADPVVRQKAACLAEAAAQVGSVQIRNIATVGGNVANASPCGDAIPALMALDARVTVLDADGRTSSKPIRDVVIGPRATSLLPGEVITDFTFAPLRPRECHGAFAKIGSRSTVSVARLSVAIVVSYDAATGLLSQRQGRSGRRRRHCVSRCRRGGVARRAPAEESTAQGFAQACAEARGPVDPRTLLAALQAVRRRRAGLRRLERSRALSCLRACLGLNPDGLDRPVALTGRLRRVAPVDDQGLTGHEARLVRGQESDGGGHFFGPSVAAQRVVLAAGVAGPRHTPPDPVRRRSCW